MTHNILLLTEVFVFLAYVIYVAFEYGIQPSISDSWYAAPRRKAYLFTLFCFTVGGIHAAQGGIFFFLSGSLLVFVGVATEFKIKKSIERVVHVTGALGSIVLSSLGLIIEHKIWHPVAVLIVVIVAIRREENATWWAEIFSFLFIMSGIALIK